MMKINHSTGFRHDAFPYALLITCLVALSAAAQDVHERSDLGLMQRQINAIELLADRARSSATLDMVSHRLSEPMIELY